jgi:tRNA U34 5-methylaminomethyl-2-thiouridine-forming methyltransferase MnmC
MLTNNSEITDKTADETPTLPDNPISEPPGSNSLGLLVLTDDGSYTIQDNVTGECYHSRMGARREAEELYINFSGFCNSLQNAHGNKITVLDVGLGLGYNAAATLEAWLRADHPPSVHMVSLENNPHVIQNILDPKAPWTANWSQPVREALRGMNQRSPNCWVSTVRLPPESSPLLNTGGLAASQDPSSNFLWEIFLIDAAQEALPYSSHESSTGMEFCHPCQGGDLEETSPLCWDFVWQDPFSPQRNPQMWSSSWFGKIRRQCHSRTKILTYSVARSVRDALEEAGFSWEKRATPFPMKKHWLVASPRTSESPPR